MTPGEIWFVRDKSNIDAKVERVEIMYINGNVVGFGDAYYDIRLLDFVARDYEEEERKAQEKFMASFDPVMYEGEVPNMMDHLPEFADFIAHSDNKQTYTPAIDFGPDSKICSINEPYSYQVTATNTKLSWLERFKLCLHELRVSLLRT